MRACAPVPSAALALLILAVAGWLAMPVTARAHALLTASEPAGNSSLFSPPTSVTLSFTEPADPRLSRIQVFDTAGKPFAAGAPQPVAGHPEQLRVLLQPLPRGTFTVSWRSVSSVDGHAASGSFGFGVGVPAATAKPGGQGAEGTSSASSAAVPPGVVFARWLLYLGLVGMLGAAFVGTVVARTAAVGVPRLVVGALVLAAIATVALVFGQAADAGVGPGDLVRSSLARTLVARAGPLVIGAIGIALAQRSPTRRAGLLVAGIAAAVAALIDAGTSHAAAGPLAPLNVAIQWLHITVAGLWVGGVAALLVQVRGAPSETKAETARRFASVAGAGIAIVGVTGIARAVVEVGNFDQLFASDFGRLILLKSVLLIALGSLGAVNHFVSVPAAARSLRALRRAGSLEITVACAALLLAAALVNIPPPTEAQAATPTQPPPPPLMVNGNDYATSVRVRLDVTPGITGPNDFRASVADYDTAAAVDAPSLTLRFRLSEHPDVGPSTLVLPRVAPGTYQAGGTNLSLDGTWAVTALVDRGTASVEVPLQVTVAETRQEIEVNRIAGLPTIYTVRLASGRSVQVYLDPDKSGRNQLHVTFFDAAGSELAATRIRVTAARAGSTPRQLRVQILEPGHAAANVDIDQTSQTYVVAATAPGGEQLRAQVEITPGT